MLLTTEVMKYDKEYFFIRKGSDNERLPSLSPSENIEDGRYRYQRQLPGSPPLIFSNGWRDENLAEGIKDETADILFDGSDFMVRGKIWEQLIAFQIPNLSVHPAVYIDDRDVWHGDYWYLTFTDRLDCWDRLTSTYDPKPIELGGEKSYSMKSYSLDDKVLNTIPLKDRLLFKMGSTSDEMIVCHISLCGKFRGGGKSGAVLQAITDW